MCGPAPGVHLSTGKVVTIVHQYPKGIWCWNEKLQKTTRRKKYIEIREEALCGRKKLAVHPASLILFQMSISNEMQQRAEGEKLHRIEKCCKRCLKLAKEKGLI
jgi:hypothetical protein